MAELSEVEVDTAGLEEFGFTVVKGFMDKAACKACRDSLDSFLGAQCESVGEPARSHLGHPSQGVSRSWLHSVTHPNPAMAVPAQYMRKMTDAHCQVLRSDPQHARLNGQTLLRTDPYRGGSAVRASNNPTNIHIDNAFLPEQTDGTPRQHYSRSIVYLNDVTEGGAPVVVWPRSTAAVRDVVERLRAEQGDDAYHGVRWRNEVTEELVDRSATAGEEGGERLQFRTSAATDTTPTPPYDAGVVRLGLEPVEVLMEEGDMVFFEPMSLHSASRCVNGKSRYCWVSAFFDERALEMPHKLYQETFSEAFVEAIPAELRPVVDWLPPFVERFLGKVMGTDTQFWCYGARTSTLTDYATEGAKLVEETRRSSTGLLGEPSARQSRRPRL